MNRRAFTLVEVSVSALVLSLALLVCFQLFQWGARVSMQGQLRAGIEGEGRRILLAIRNDLMRSDYTSLETLSRNATNAEGVSVARHALCCFSLQNWSAASSFAPDSAVPLWDRYLVIYATRSNPGLLVKQLYAPAGAPYVNPFGQLSSLVNDDPSSNPGSIQHLILGQSIESFEIHCDEDSKSVNFDILLGARGARKGEGSKVNERHQLRFSVRLENSGP
ncbi:hypothetical protein JST97_04520 [bacterium]|nr:hypothetical protein [bacterium]